MKNMTTCNHVLKAHSKKPSSLINRHIITDHKSSSHVWHFQRRSSQISGQNISSQWYPLIESAKDCTHRFLFINKIKIFLP